MASARAAAPPRPAMVVSFARLAGMPPFSFHQLFLLQGAAIAFRNGFHTPLGSGIHSPLRLPINRPLFSFCFQYDLHTSMTAPARGAPYICTPTTFFSCASHARSPKTAPSFSQKKSSLSSLARYPYTKSSLVWGCSGCQKRQNCFLKEDCLAEGLRFLRNYQRFRRGKAVFEAISPILTVFRCCGQRSFAQLSFPEGFWTIWGLHGETTPRRVPSLKFSIRSVTVRLGRKRSILRILRLPPPHQLLLKCCGFPGAETAWKRFLPWKMILRRKNRFVPAVHEATLPVFPIVKTGRPWPV